MQNGEGKVEEKQTAEDRDADSAMGSNAGSSYLTSCSKVTRDAYNRVIEQLHFVQEKDRHTQSSLEKILLAQEEREKAEFEKRKAEALATKQVLQIQIDLKKQQQRTERAREQVDYKTVIAEMPENVINVYPRITETPLEKRKDRKTQLQEELKKELKEQMAKKAQRASEERRRVKEQELASLQKTHEQAQKAEEESKVRDKQKLDQYKLELSKDIQCKEMRKLNDKRLGSIEFQGMTALHDLLTSSALPLSQDPNVPVPASVPEGSNPAPREATLPSETVHPVKAGTAGDPEDNVATVSPPLAAASGSPASDQHRGQGNDQQQLVGATTDGDAKMDKLALILEKKQRKANELLEKLETHQRKQKGSSSLSPEFSVDRLKAALNPAAYSMKRQGKDVRLSSQEVAHIIQKAKPLAGTGEETKSHVGSEKFSKSLTAQKSEGSLAKSPTERAQRKAYDRYLAQLQSQASEEQKRILDTLKREREAIERIKEKEEKLQQQRKLYRHMILDEIARKKDQKGFDLKTTREVPDIAGTQGYPPLFEPSPVQQREKVLLAYKKQKDLWIQQVSGLLEA